MSPLPAFLLEMWGVIMHLKIVNRVGSADVVFGVLLRFKQGENLDCHESRLLKPGPRAFVRESVCAPGQPFSLKSNQGARFSISLETK